MKFVPHRDARRAHTQNCVCVCVCVCVWGGFIASENNLPPNRNEARTSVFWRHLGLFQCHLLHQYLLIMELTEGQLAANLSTAKLERWLARRKRRGSAKFFRLTQNLLPWKIKTPRVRKVQLRNSLPYLCRCAGSFSKDLCSQTVCYFQCLTTASGHIFACEN